jgi:hypothetical protein
MGRTSRNWSFLVPVVLFTLACAFTVWLAFMYAGIRMGQMEWGILSYYMLITLFLHAWQERAMLHDPGGFVRRYVAGLGLKMLASFMVLVLLLLRISGERVLPVVLTFILLYLAYLAFSTARMTMVLKRNSGR